MCSDRSRGRWIGANNVLNGGRRLKYRRHGSVEPGGGYGAIRNGGTWRNHNRFNGRKEGGLKIAGVEDARVCRFVGVIRIGGCLSRRMFGPQQGVRMQVVVAARSDVYRGTQRKPDRKQPEDRFAKEAPQRQ